MDIALFLKIGGGVIIAAAIISLIIGAYKCFFSPMDNEVAEGSLTAGKVLLLISLLWLITSEIISKYFIG